MIEPPRHGHSIGNAYKRKLPSPSLSHDEEGSVMRAEDDALGSSNPRTYVQQIVIRLFERILRWIRERFGLVVSHILDA